VPASLVALVHDAGSSADLSRRHAALPLRWNALVDPTRQVPAKQSADPGSLAEALRRASADSTPGIVQPTSYRTHHADEATLGTWRVSSLTRSSHVRLAATRRASRCQSTLASSSTSAAVAASGSDPRRAIAACSAPLGARRARRSRLLLAETSGAARPLQRACRRSEGATRRHPGAAAEARRSMPPQPGLRECDAALRDILILRCARVGCGAAGSRAQSSLSGPPQARGPTPRAARQAARRIARGRRSRAARRGGPRTRRGRDSARAPRSAAVSR
jgi:hypothetical protein